MKQLFRHFAVLSVLLFAAISASAQVTVSSISGHIYDKSGDIENAVVIAVHTPTGTEYHAVTDQYGNYRIRNMRVGGPYTITVDLLGYAQAKATGVTLKLGENFVWDVELKEETLSLDALVFSAELENPVLNSDKSGTSTNLSSRELEILPTGTRTINDMVRLTPQSTGMSFGGRDSRMNNFTVDGAGFNNNFGLSSDLPGGDSGPISFDAIEEISVNLAPYDVRQSRFTGAAINAVTKSGTNNVEGSVYTYQKFKGMTGGKVGDVAVNTQDLKSQTYGFSIGAPIIKNKLFFFLNAEYSPTTSPSSDWRPSVDGVSDAANGIARTKIEDLKKVKDYLLKNYGYDPGEFGENGWSSFNDYNYKILARIDWNINNDHKLMLRYSDVKNSVGVLTNGNSTATATSPDGISFRDKKSNRISEQSIAFSNSFYRDNQTVKSVALELNSKFSERISNQLTANYNMISTLRSTDSEIFPGVDIYEGGKKYMYFGYEPFSYNNGVINNTANIIDNVTINLGNHLLTAGVAFEYMFVKNSYIREATSNYRYESLQDFLDNKKPTGIAITYGFNGEDAPGQKMNYAQASLYVQDEWNATDRFKLTYGVRFEMPFYLDKDMLRNNKIYEIGEVHKYPGGPWDTSTWPKNRMTINPRVGFNWDVLGDRSLQLRGGTGVFAGVNPFVWFTNQVGAAGFVQSTEMVVWGSQLPDDFKFTPDFKKLLSDHPTLFPTKPDMDFLPKNSALCLVDKKFRFPQIWRSNIAVDVKLPWNMVFTGEILYSKDIVAVRQINANQAPHTGAMEGPDNRFVWEGANALDQSGLVANAMLFTNTNKGHAFQATAQLTKNFSNGFSGMLAYTYSHVKDVTAQPASAAASAWQQNMAVNSLNENELGFSNFALPHRIVGNLSYQINYARCMSTTLSLFYQGSHYGRYSYVYNGDVNGDGQSMTDLMYIPANPSEIQFVDLVSNGNLLASAADQSKAFFDYIENDGYLRRHKGQYVDRYSGLSKWVNKFDFKVLQDLYTNFGTDNRYSLQLSLDILNVGNLINSNWGCYYQSSAYNAGALTPLTVASKGTTKKAPTYTLNVGDASKVKAGEGVQAFQKYTSWTKAPVAANCWSMLLGIRLTF